MIKAPEGWINRIENGAHKFVNIVPEAGKEPTITYFDNKQIYLPEEAEKYEKEVLRKGDNIVWLGFTGWTKPPKHYPALYGASDEPGIYDSLVLALIMESALALKKQGIEVDLRHGASDAGVDAAAMIAMEKLNLTGSGVNCPLYMPWVKDNTRGGPVLVAESKEAYHDLFSKYHQILIVTGGRDVAFHHDYLRRLKGEGYSIVADVMQTVSDRVIQAMDRASDQDKITMNNAAAYIREKNSFSYNPIPRNFDELILRTNSAIIYNAAKLLQREPDYSLLDEMEKEAIEIRAKNKSAPHKITKNELEERVSRVEQEFKSF